MNIKILPVLSILKNMVKNPSKSIKDRVFKSLKNSSFIIFLLLSIVSIVIWRIAEFTEHRSLEQLRSTGELRVNLYAGSLSDALEKYRHLPYVLARDGRIQALLLNDIPSIRINPHLEDFSRTSGGLIFVLDDGGTTVATSNWRTQQSLMGHNFSFRPYFSDAKVGRAGGYYAVGFRTRQPGFFLSYPVKHLGKFKGAVVVKVDLEPLQSAWKQGGEAVIVSDAYGVIFLTSNTDWKYQSLRQLPEKTVNRLQAVQYLNLPLTALQMRRSTIKEHNVLELEGTRYLEQSLQLPEYGWRIHYLTNLRVVQEHVKLAVTIATILVILFFLILLYLRERRQKLFSLQEARGVQAVRKINKQLLEEISIRKEAQENLVITQNELIQAGKLVALGRMSAAIAHELNQPVTAIRTFVASCRVFVERSQPDNVLENLALISQLTNRMGKITGQLKTFAKKSKGKEEHIDLIKVINRTIQLLSPQIEFSESTLNIEIPQDCIANVSGDGLQLEQVMSNLIHNALDALREVEVKIISLFIRTTHDKVMVTVSDTGHGISEEALDSLFDPFFTTKDIGEGLGLGLSITYGIVQEMEGTIRANNNVDGGASFTIEFPLIKQGKIQYE